VQANAYQLGDEEKRELLALARGCVTAHLRGEPIPQMSSQLLAKYPFLQEPRSCFVTLRKHGELRGCIGSLEPRRSLIEDVRQNAISAAIHDTRFEPVVESELSEIDFEISVLDLPKLLQGVPSAELPAYLKRHQPGLIIEYRGRRSTFLPSVWEQLPEPLDFLAHLCRKQGSAYDCWKDPAVRISTYGAVHFGEKNTP
jgi:AmmeMemoRadiSam system protein A